MAEQARKIPFGPADITIGDGPDAITFDGKIGKELSELQAEGGTINIEPTFADINSIDFGESAYDQYTTGVNVTVTIVALHESIRTLKLAIAGAQDVTDAENGVTGVTDGPVGQSNRDKGVRVNIHPRNMGDDKSFDYTIYKMAPTESFERPFNLEQGTIQIQFVAYPRDGADASKGGNFYYTGAVDPNAEASS